MTGHHIVERFFFSGSADSINLPDNCKPFAAFTMPALFGDAGQMILTRRWVRDEASADRETE